MGESALTVETGYFDAGADGGSFYNDILTGLRRAWDQGDHAGSDILWDLWLVYLEESLGRKSSSKLEGYIRTRKVWRWFGEDPVIKSGDTPCVAYTVFRTNDKLLIVGLGACYRYPPGGEEVWWQNVILPRLRSL